ncbi:MAG: hypothetical protein EAX91_08460 [Candidatus Lokiarchaeota archaeon]|nr:hypothetical protein [Candidatus Lokiarchaeota archaeon]
MKKIKLFTLVTVSVLFLTALGTVIAYPSSIESFAGASHTGCHGFSTVSASGAIVLNSDKGTTLSPGEKFNLTAEITGFTEAITIDRGSECSIAVAPTRGDNADFASPLSVPIRFSGVPLDGTGASGVISFILLAPATAGTYSLVVDAINGINHTASAATSIIFASATMTITVTAAAPAAGIPGFNLLIVVSVSLLAVIPLVLIVRKKKNRK